MSLFTFKNKRKSSPLKNKEIKFIHFRVVAIETILLNFFS